MCCQACKIRPIEITEKCDDEVQPYELCYECHKRLTSFSLRPIEWYNLASVHTFNKFMLHDDFYEDSGEATQPEEDVENAENYLAPVLAEVKDNIDALLDYCISKWWLNEDMIYFLKQHEPDTLLYRVKDRFCRSNNYFVEDRLYEIASKSLGEYCEDWIREQWQMYKNEHLIRLSQAACLCFPFDEGYNLVINELENIQGKNLPNTAFACLYKFRTPLTLEWIESKAQDILKDSWGKLAAASNPSWDKLKEWIEKGRPYSLIALDCLLYLIPHPGEIALRRLIPAPKLIKASSVEAMSQVLKEYSEKDKVPRVRKSVEKVLNNWNNIL